MRPASISLAPEGFPLLVLLGLCSLCFAALDWGIATVVALIFFLFTLHFFRDPERVVPKDEGLAVSPADGKIIKIEQRPDPLDREVRTCISVFMNVFNVHVNRCPVDGTVTEVRYHPGKFINASFDKASEHNERCTWRVMDTEGRPWTFVQIAGLVARRIVPHAEQGDTLARGQRFGMIRFGSRVDLYLPEGYDSAVHIGQTVLAGQSVLARRAVPQTAAGSDSGE
ncbi:MAG TPA: phosphatidylserine decarboxylase family protein [Candidatus Mailhella merdavium]|nr:phosphatidylserine decarboxylase family protein [Candidatus Mailhella merdavium]